VRAGRRRTEAVIQQNVPTRDAVGGEIEHWAAFVATWWCELVQVQGGETFRGRVVHASANYVASGCYVAGVTPKMRMTIAAGARIFDVLAADDVEGRSRELRLALKERNL
jgi:head-tail adaptor